MSEPGIKRRLYDILEPSEDSNLSRWFDIALIALICINVVAVILETVESYYSAFKPWFDGLELFTVAVFTVEYLARMVVCTEGTHYSHPLFGRLRYSLTPMALIDLLAILPFWLSLTAVDGRIIRFLRIFRIMRIAKLARYSVAMRILGRVFINSRAELMITFLVLMVLLVIASTIMYFAEHEAQPVVFSSIPASMWWGVATLTTVGYGDITPVTVVGRIIGSVIAILGIGMFALPAGILGSAFVTEMQQHKQRFRDTHLPQNYCPHCGQPLHEEHP